MHKVVVFMQLRHDEFPFSLSRCFSLQTESALSVGLFNSQVQNPGESDCREYFI